MFFKRICWYCLLGGFIRNPFLSLTPYNRDPPIPPRFIYFEPSTSPASFYTGVCDIPSSERSVYIAKEIKWYKEKEGSRHEYLVARLQRKRGSRVGFAVVERGLSPSASVVRFSSTSSPPSLSEQATASDRISCYGSKEDILNRRVNNDTLLATYTFPDLSLLEFSRLVKIVSEHGHNYPTNTAMGCWFSAMIMEVARRQFSPRHPNKIPVPAGPFTGAGKDMCFSLMTPQWTEDFAIIEQKYKDDRSADPDPLDIYQQAIRKETAEHEQEVAKVREETAKRIEQETAEYEQEMAKIKEETAKIKEETAKYLQEIAKLEQEIAKQKETLREEAENGNEAPRSLQE
ncbi:hypothetical protein JB92DRAFT_3142156 [Gautieria morchelliformis]|nr:hypothetical protein JB92DRAFT_3142156 [Gautieria morchelliformis]